MLDCPYLTRLVGSRSAPVAELIEARCTSSPLLTFIRTETCSYSYGETLLRARSFAAQVQHHDLATGGVRIVSVLSKRPETLWVWFGALLAGCSYGSISAQAKGLLIQEPLSKIRPSIMVTEKSLWPVIQFQLPSSIRLVVFVDEVPEKWEIPNAVAEPLNSDPESMCYRRPSFDLGAEAGFLLTSGTTGRSKIVSAGQQYFGRAAAYLAEALEMTCDDVLYDWAPQHHVGNQVDDVMAVLVSGASLALVSGFSRSKFWQQLRESKATLFSGFSNIFSYLLSNPTSVHDREHDLRLAVAINTPGPLRDAFAARFNVPLVDYYGMTEAPIVTLPSIAAQPTGSCGRASPDFELAIHDDHGWPCAPGRKGRIVFRPLVPDVVMRSYVDDPDATVAAWRDLWIHTQDCGLLDVEGYLHFVDRLTNSIRRGGENISPSELEKMVGADAFIGECVAIGVPTEIGDEEIKLVVRPAVGSTLSAEGAYQICARVLPRFMLPRYIAVVDSLVFSDVGKVDRTRYRKVEESDWDRFGAVGDAGNRLQDTN